MLATILLALASAIVMALRYDPDGGSLAYYATDARASGFLLGAALARMWRPPAWSRPLPRTARSGIDAAGIVALVTLLVGFVAGSEFDDGLYLRGGFLRVGLLSAVVIVAATRGGGVVAALLSRRLVVAVGRRSYGLYLYHWPIFVLGRALPLPTTTTIALSVSATVAVAEVSYRWIETPVRRGGLAALMGRMRLPRSVGVVAFGAATSAVLTTVVALTGPGNTAGEDPATAVVADNAGAPADQTRGGQAAGPGRSPCAATSGATGPGVYAGQATERSVSGGQAPAPGSAAATRASGGADQDCGLPVAPNVATGAPAGSKGPGSNEAGSNGPGGNGPGGPAGAPEPLPAASNPGGPPGTARPALVVGDSIALGSADSLRRALGAGSTVDAKVGRQFSAAPDIVMAWAAVNHGPIVVDLGANGTVAADDVAAVIAAAGDRRIVLVGVHVPRRWQDGNNAVLRGAAAAHPSAAFVDWDALVDTHPGALGPDGVHPSPAGRTLLANAVAAAARSR